MLHLSRRAAGPAGVHSAALAASANLAQLQVTMLNCALWLPNAADVQHASGYTTTVVVCVTAASDLGDHAVHWPLAFGSGIQPLSPLHADCLQQAGRLECLQTAEAGLAFTGELPKLTTASRMKCAGAYLAKRHVEL